MTITGLTFFPWLPQRKLHPFNSYLRKREIKQSDWRTFSIIFTFTAELSRSVFSRWAILSIIFKIHLGLYSITESWKKKSQRHEETEWSKYKKKWKIPHPFTESNCGILSNHPDDPSWAQNKNSLPSPAWRMRIFNCSQSSCCSYNMGFVRWKQAQEADLFCKRPGPKRPTETLSRDFSFLIISEHIHIV